LPILLLLLPFFSFSCDIIGLVFIHWTGTHNSKFVMKCRAAQKDGINFWTFIFCNFTFWYTGGLKSHTTYIKIFIDGCNSVHLVGLMNTQYCCYLQDPTQVTSCCNLLAPVHQLSFNRQSARMSFSQVQQMFIVEHYLASRSYLTCQNRFRDTFPDSRVPNKSTSCLVNCFRDTGTFHWLASNMRKRVNACIAESGWHFQHLI
jgi:hypothetical protein